eukprot:202082-Lingulodinium_polyedra.AAC.1
MAVAPCDDHAPGHEGTSDVASPLGDLPALKNTAKPIASDALENLPLADQSDGKATAQYWLFGRPAERIDG